MTVVKVEDLSKTYKSPKKEQGLLGTIKSLVTREMVEVKAVQNINFEIQEGELVGFLGPNGAGKTTTLKMLSGIMHPTTGRAEVFGYIPWKRQREMQKQISLVMGQKMQLWWDLPAYESFVLLKELYEVDDATFKKRLNFMAEILEVSNLLHQQVRKLSLGERMKCELIAALLHAPRVVFLDEPTIGLDVVSQKRIREFLLEINAAQKTTVLLTSHYMQDVEAVCERVIIIDQGQLIFDNSLKGLIAEHSKSKVLRLVFANPVTCDELVRYGKVRNCDGLNAIIEVPRAETSTIAAAILTHLPVEDITIDEADIEDIIRVVFAEGRT
ncbi:MAG: ATP-binding cassette domain-containing protein [bacterium]